jgi:hypothetical protein
MSNVSFILFIFELQIKSEILQISAQKTLFELFSDLTITKLSRIVKNFPAFLSDGFCGHNNKSVLPLPGKYSGSAPRRAAHMNREIFENIA